MPRYTKQREHTTCGPVAILNALRWAGQDAPYSLTKTKIRKVCEWNSTRGTRHSPFDKALRKFGGKYFSIRKRHRPSLKEIRQHLAKNQALVLNYAWKSGDDYGRHFSLLVLKDGSVRRVNGVWSGPALSLIGKGGFHKHELRFQRAKSRGVVAWFLTRKEKD